MSDMFEPGRYGESEEQAHADDEGEAEPQPQAPALQEHIGRYCAVRALIEAREAAARDMGLTRLIADTLTPNVEIRGLYPKLGFTEVDGPIETTTYFDQPMLRPHLHYFVKEL